MIDGRPLHQRLSFADFRVGWGYVSERLKERKTYYEANQRGLFATKDREMQLRDRLIQQQEVR